MFGEANVRPIKNGLNTWISLDIYLLFILMSYVLFSKTDTLEYISYYNNNKIIIIIIK